MRGCWLWRAAWHRVRPKLLPYKRPQWVDCPALLPKAGSSGLLNWLIMRLLLRIVCCHAGAGGVVMQGDPAMNIRDFNGCLA